MAAIALSFIDNTLGMRPGFILRVRARVAETPSNCCLRLDVLASAERSPAMNALAIMVWKQGVRKSEREVWVSNGSNQDAGDSVFRAVCTGTRLPLAAGTKVELIPLPIKTLVERGQQLTTVLSNGGCSRKNLDALYKILRSLDPHSAEPNVTTFIQETTYLIRSLLIPFVKIPTLADCLNDVHRLFSAIAR